jgi:hypothetical protein
MIRQLASRLLSATISGSSPASREWGNAMLREMDSVEGDWAALFWALGSSRALCGYSLRIWLRFDRQRSEALSLEKLARRIPAIVSGLAVAGIVLTICILGLISVMHQPWFKPEHARFVDRLLFVTVPEIVYFVSIVALWRQRRWVALGVLAGGVILMTHALIHFVTHL